MAHSFTVLFTHSFVFCIIILQNLNFSKCRSIQQFGKEWLGIMSHLYAFLDTLLKLGSVCFLPVMCDMDDLFWCDIENTSIQLKGGKYIILNVTCVNFSKTWMKGLRFSGVAFSRMGFYFLSWTVFLLSQC